MASGVRGWAVGFYALALAFNYPHYMATVYRAYHTQSEFARYRIFTLHLPPGRTPSLGQDQSSRLTR